MQRDDELSHAIRNAPDVDAVSRAARAVAGALGFDHFLVGLRCAQGPAEPCQLVISGYPRAWRERYDAAGYMRIDPVLQQALVRLEPFGWDETRRGRALAGLFEEAALHGLAHGLTVPMHGPRAFALLSLARARPLPQGGARRTLFGRALWFACLLHEQLRARVADGGASAAHKPLSRQERACLARAAQGRSAHAIGEDLHITERTVVYYLRRAGQKLGARTRQHAIALAVARGLLDAQAYPAEIGRSQSLVELAA